MSTWVRSLLGYSILVTGGLSGLLILPLMLVSRTLREAHFVFFYSLCQHLWKRDFDEVRRTLLLQLDDLVSHDASLRERRSLRVLEVGAAYGPNLPFVRRAVQYWKVEPNAHFDDAFQASLKENPNVELVRSICGYGEDMAELPDGHFDAVILTYVLCSAIDGRKLLSEIKRVLTKGGLLLFSEHVGHRKGTVARSFQDFFTPLTKWLSLGCHMNRDSGSLLKGAGFASIQTTELDMDIAALFSCQIYGAATA
ncbi:thiol S-methyltransferase TMT1B-like [Haemaphysalis longicornis]